MTPAGLGNKYLYTMDPAVIEKFNPRGSLIPEEISPSNSNIYHHASEAGISFRYLFVLNLTELTVKIIKFNLNKAKLKNYHLLEKLMCAAPLCA